MEFTLLFAVGLSQVNGEDRDTVVIALWRSMAWTRSVLGMYILKHKVDE